MGPLLTLVIMLIHDELNLKRQKYFKLGDIHFQLILTRCWEIEISDISSDIKEELSSSSTKNELNYVKQQ